MLGQKPEHHCQKDHMDLNECTDFELYTDACLISELQNVLHEFNLFRRMFKKRYVVYKKDYELLVYRNKYYVYCFKNVLGG